MKAKVFVKKNIFLVGLLTLLLCASNAAHAEENVLQNPGFEQDFDGWLHWHSNNGDGIEEIVTTDSYEGSRCLKMQNRGSRWIVTYQDIGRLIPGGEYILSTMFRTSPDHMGRILLLDRDWKDSTGAIKGKGFFTQVHGNNEWLKIRRVVHIPLYDDFGEEVANHNWRVYLYGNFPQDSSVPVYYDEVGLSLGTMFLPPFGCTNDARSKSIDFGSADEGNSGITYNASAMTDMSADGEIMFRSIRPEKGLVIEFPAFNVDADGFPLTPMLLEIRFKDTIDDTVGATRYYTYNRAFVYSRVDIIHNEPYVYYPHRRYHLVSHLGGYADNNWRYMQQVFQKSQFQLLRAVDGKFTMLIKMPQGASELFLPIDYASLRAITQEEYRALVDKQREMRGFYEVRLVPDEPPAPVSYLDSDPAVFVPDIMRPVYPHTRPDLSGRNKDIFAFCARGETEPMSFAIYSKDGANNVTLSVSDLCSSHGIIPKENVSLSRVVCDEKRLTPYASNALSLNTYGMIPDRLEEVTSLSICAGTSERIWLKVRVPADIAGGLYEGNISLMRNGAEIESLPFALNVLPLELDLPGNISMVHNDPYDMTLPVALDEVFRLYRETGFDPLFHVRRIEPIVDGNGDISDFDTAVFEAKLDRMIQEGFAKKRVTLWDSTWGKIYEHIHGCPFKSSDREIYAKLSDQRFADAYGLLIRRVIGIGNAKNISFAFFVVDEPNRDPYKRIVADRLYTIIQDNGGKTLVSYNCACEEEVEATHYIVPGGVIPPLIERIDYKVWSGSSQGGGYLRSHDIYGYYTTSSSYLRNPVYNRFLHGLLAFRTDADVVWAYAMSRLVNDPFNDFDAEGRERYPFTYPDFIFAYPTWSGKLLPTMGMEGIREGIKDAKYIATLKRLIAENPASPVACEAAAYLDSIKERINTDYWNAYLSASTQYGYCHRILEDISEAGDPDDFEAFSRIRSTVAHYIMELSTVPNQPPVLDPIDDQTTDEGQLLTFTISATDPDGDKLHFLPPVHSILMKGIEFVDNGDNSATFSWRPHYEQSGEHRVIFTVSDGESTDSAGITITVHNVNMPPTCSIEITPRRRNRYGFRFNAAASDPDGKIVIYYWDLGDGTRCTKKRFWYKYASPGAYTVRLIVGDNEGALSEWATEEILIAPNQPPTCSIEVTPHPMNRYKFKFTAIAGDPDGEVVRCYWDLGNGYRCTRRSFWHTYASPGTYTVRLIVRDNERTYSEWATEEILVPSSQIPPHTEP